MIVSDEDRDLIHPAVQTSLLLSLCPRKATNLCPVQLPATTPHRTLLKGLFQAISQLSS